MDYKPPTAFSNKPTVIPSTPYKPPTAFSNKPTVIPSTPYKPPNEFIYNPRPLLPYKLGDRVKFRDGRSEKEWKGRIENVQYIIKPDGASELMPVDLSYILGSDSTGGRRNTQKNRKNKRKTRQR
jgi:hypothetical protein